MTFHPAALPTTSPEAATGVPFAYLFETFGIPVAVALATTLTLELFARPRLEARKARLIRDRTRIDDLIFAFQGLALTSGALLPNASLGLDQANDYQRYQLAAMEVKQQELLDTLGKLGTAYAMRHQEHIGYTAKFIGYFHSRTQSILHRDALNETDSLRGLTGKLEKFDVYFRSHVGMKDSQEPLVKRLSWPLLFGKGYRAEAKAVTENLGLEPNPPLDPHDN